MRRSRRHSAAPSRSDPGADAAQRAGCFALLADGLRGDEIAERLSISSLTVRTHVKHAMDKLKATTRTEAVAIAMRRSLLP